MFACVVMLACVGVSRGGAWSTSRGQAGGAAAAPANLTGVAGGKWLRQVAEFATHPLIVRESRVFESRCACVRRIEAGRAELHASLDRVLVVDMRMFWNGIGNSLTRWLAVLRLGWTRTCLVPRGRITVSQ